MGHHRARDGDEPDDLTVEQVRSTLHDAADAYRPDRTAMVNRVAVGRAATLPDGGRARRTLFRMRPAAAALAVTAILVASISAARLSGGPDRTVAADRPPVGVTAPAATSSPSPAAGGTGSSPATAGTTGTPRSPASSVPARNGPAATATLDASAAPNGFLTSGGAVSPNSGPTWSEDTVSLTSTQPLVELTVTITVALSPGAAEAGKYTTVPNADMTMTVTRTATALVYSYALHNGRRLAPGGYTFGAQFVHSAGRTNTDSYTVVARTTTTGAQLTGAFT